MNKISKYSNFKYFSLNSLKYNISIIPSSNIIELKILFNGIKKWKKIETKQRKNNPKIPVSPIELFILFPKI